MFTFQMRTAGELIKDAGYWPQPSAPSKSQLALVGNTGKALVCASKLDRPQLGRTTTRITDQIERDVMSTDTLAAPLVSGGFDINAQFRSLL
jgi:hypothetical protein